MMLDRDELDVAREEERDQKKMIIKFIDVGRERKSWAFETERIDYNQIFSSIKKNGGLISRGIDFDLDEESGTGVIFAGDRAVGKIEIEKEKGK